MKKKLLSSAISAIVLVASTSALAAKDDNKSQGASNGQPFQELYGLIDENRALIDANIGGIQDLQSDVISIGGDISNLASDLLLLDGRVSVNENDIADLQARVDGLDTNVASLVSDLDQLRINHDADIADIEAMIAFANQEITNLQTNLTSLTISLNAQLASISASVGDNAIAIDSLVIELASTTAMALSNLLSINGLQTQVDGLEVRADQLDVGIIDLQTQINELDSRLTVVEDAVHDHNEGLCFSFTNTPAEDLIGNDWFDACVDAAMNGGSEVTVILRDNSGNVVYQASGDIVGNWTQNQITSVASASQQFFSTNHDRLVSLDNGDKLMISGKSASNSGFGGSFGNGYGIVVYPTNPNYYFNPKLIATSYRQIVGYNGIRSFGGWTEASEISWNNGASFTTRPSDGGVTGLEFQGSFEVYVD